MSRALLTRLASVHLHESAPFTIVRRVVFEQPVSTYFWASVPFTPIYKS
jgi:hypothetical protein